MKKIVGVIKPFEKFQKCYVYDDGQKIEETNFTLEELPKALLVLSSQYQIKDIDLTGSKNFSSGIKKFIEKEEILKNGKNILKINVI